MRLFIAINFPFEIKDGLMKVISDIKDFGRGAFTREENLHLTLAFIGETDRVEELRRIVGSVSFSPFYVSVGGLGHFGDLYFARVSPSPELLSVEAELRKKLKLAGFKTEERPFSPHITLVRRFSGVIPDSFTVKSRPGCISRLSLMESSRINGRLTYTEIYGKSVK